MDFSRNKGGSPARYGGMGIVVLTHVILAYALVTTLAHTMKAIANRPVQVKIIDEKLPPPPPPPDTPLPPPPNLTAPPPPFIPPPEVRIQLPPVENSIAVTTTVAPPPQPFTKTIVTPPQAQPVPISRPPTVLHLPPVPAFSDLNACKPTYPQASLLAEEEGTVRVEFVIGANGQLLSNRIVKSSGYNDLDRATLNGLSRCKFKPAYRDGKPVQSSFLSDYVWRLDE